MKRGHPQLFIQFQIVDNKSLAIFGDNSGVKNNGAHVDAKRNGLGIKRLDRKKS